MLFDCRDKVPRVKAIDCPREVRSGICNDREFGIIKDLQNRLGIGRVRQAKCAELDGTMGEGCEP